MHVDTKPTCPISGGDPAHGVAALAGLSKPVTMKPDEGKQQLPGAWEHTSKAFSKSGSMDSRGKVGLGVGLEIAPWVLSFVTS